MNTKYILSNVLKISEISRVRVYRKRVNFLFIFFPLRGKNFFPSYFSLILLGSARLVGILLGGSAVFAQKMVYNGILMNG